MIGKEGSKYIAHQIEGVDHGEALLPVVVDAGVPLDAPEEAQVVVGLERGVDVLRRQVEEQGGALVVIRDNALRLQRVHLARVCPVVVRVDFKVLPEVVRGHGGLRLVSAAVISKYGQ